MTTSPKLENYQLCDQLEQQQQQQQHVEQELSGFSHILFSLANIGRLLIPNTSLSAFIENSKTDPLKFIITNIRRQRVHLQLPYKREDEIEEDPEGYTKQNYIQYGKYKMALSIGGVPSQAHSFSVLLEKWKEQGSKGQDHEAIDYSSIKEPELAIIIGYEMAAAGYCAHPGFARTEEQLLRLGTGWIEGTCDVQEPDPHPSNTMATLRAATTPEIVHEHENIGLHELKQLSLTEVDSVAEIKAQLHHLLAGDNQENDVEYPVPPRTPVQK
ncbi:hypothetical protein HZS61_008541 [Fusarium oxysporum f. sp. conglutinans]|uniref:Uncharacterized protein n=1 Tax=Fusarium oxysporum f. sp. conglutinans TaxID=100902 RepID=A0A8H6H0R9_FUSOX|nr:hypothetical protein HZS61_008541 [Fusarium oxysporum f. sp. conglutinans]KAG7001014.1 hypothetical protein FocnCong_v012633 [Fusarium oxysporum f. sp. conglutinans]KAI8416596.1 hypothetical protein FOFC_02908 [Fusarium oxysporum]